MARECDLLERWRSARDVCPDRQAIDQTDDVLHVEICLAVLFGKRILIVNAAVNQSLDCEVLRWDIEELLEYCEIRVAS